MEKLAEKPLNPAYLVFAAWPLSAGRAPPRNSRKRAADRRGRAPRSRLPVLRLPGRREASSRYRCGFLDLALQRQAHRVVKIGGGEVGAAELQLGDEAHEKYAALPYR